jgi:hypothetical protein
MPKFKSTLLIMTVVFLVYAVVLLFYPGFGDISNYHKVSRELNDKLNSLSENNIKQISIQKGDYFNPNQTIKIITEPEILKVFVSLSKTIEQYTPNHQCYISEYLIEILYINTDKIQLLFYEKQNSDYIYIALVKSREHRISYYGNFKSKKLYHWLKTNINPMENK